MKKLLALLFLIGAAGFAGPGWAASAEGKSVLPLGSPMPAFSLTDVVSGSTVSSSDYAGKLTVVVVMCRHCPYVQHVKKGIGQLAADYRPKGVAFVGVSANDAERFPEDSPEKLKEMALEEGYAFPLLYDQTQEFAKALTAVATPDFFVFDREGKLAYRGRMDAARPGNPAPVTGEDLRRALDLLLDAQPAPAEQRPATGCSIKWKPGAEPAYWS